MQLGNVCFYCGKEGTISPCFPCIHVEFFEASGKLLTSHFSCLFFNSIRNLILQLLRYLNARRWSFWSHSCNIYARLTCIMSPPLYKRIYPPLPPSPAVSRPPVYLQMRNHETKKSKRSTHPASPCVTTCMRLILRVFFTEFGLSQARTSLWHKLYVEHLLLDFMTCCFYPKLLDDQTLKVY